MLSRPRISVIIVAYDMPREVPRTVQSFLAPYQQEMAPGDIEILVMENGSSRPVPEAVRAGWPANVRYFNIENAPGSPAYALNLGVAKARGKWVCPVIDGARIATPGILRKAMLAARLSDCPVIATMGYHLGHVVQQEAVKQGYDAAAEDALLDSIGWPQDGHRLFEIGCLGLSARKGWLAPIAESNAIIVSKAFYKAIGGYDERFDIPGGGIVNHDFFRRAVEHPDGLYVLLVGEGTFHQHHGGVTTAKGVGKPAAPDGRTTWDIYADQYRQIRQMDYAVPQRAPLLFGDLGPSAVADVQTFAGGERPE